MLKAFRNDKNYLAKYHAKASALILGANLILWWWRTPAWSEVLWMLPCLMMLVSPRVTTVLTGFVYGLVACVAMGHFNITYLLGLPAGILLTFPVTGLIHCASHKSIKPRWLNRAVGEFTGLVQLYGFPDWTILHVVHHSHTDDAELDPHPPLNKKYWEFTLGMRDTASAAFLKFYFKTFGQSEDTIQSAKHFALMSKIDTWMKLVFWMLLLGPHVFATAYVTSIAFKMMHYAWLNYSTHRPGKESAEIQNLTKGPFYKMANILAFGLYYHKNHHLVPTLFNPKNLKVKDESTTFERQIA